MKRPFCQPWGWGRRYYVYRDHYAWIFYPTRWKGYRCLSHGISSGRVLGSHLSCQWERDNLMKRPEPAKVDVGEVPPYADVGKGLEKFLKVKEFLTARYYEDGTSRKPGWIGISVEEGCFKAMLKEPTAGLIMRIDVPKLDALWPLLEAVLCLPTVPWNIDPRAEVPKQKKR